MIVCDMTFASCLKCITRCLQMRGPAPFLQKGSTIPSIFFGLSYHAGTFPIPVLVNNTFCIYHGQIYDNRDIFPGKWLLIFRAQVYHSVVAVTGKERRDCMFGPHNAPEPDFAEGLTTGSAQSIFVVFVLSAQKRNVLTSIFLSANR